MTITRFDGPDAGDTSRGRNGFNDPAGGVPVSAEERLAALLLAALLDANEPEHNANCADQGASDCPVAAELREVAEKMMPRLIAAKVSVPTEPGAPDPCLRCGTTARSCAAFANRQGGSCCDGCDHPGEPDPDVEALADLFMDLRLDGPAKDGWTYQQTARHYARIILGRWLAGIRPDPTDPLATSASTDRPR